MLDILYLGFIYNIVMSDIFKTGIQPRSSCPTSFIGGPSWIFLDGSPLTTCGDDGNARVWIPDPYLWG